MADSVSSTTSTENQVQSFTRSTQDREGESLAASRFIGYLRKDQTRLNVFSALSKNDLQDNFHFRVMEKGAVGLNYTTNGEDPDIRIQVIGRNTGRVVADSGLRSGPGKDNWDKLGTGELDLAAGEYVVRVQRHVGGSRATSSAYAIQVSMGTTYKGDYDTTETPAARAYTQVQEPATVIASILDTSTNYNLGIFSLLI